MEKKVCVFFAEGFEEIEGLTVIDLLRRAGIETTMVSVMDGKKVTGSHGIVVETDICFGEMDYGNVDMLVLPGGMPGTTNLQEHKELNELLCRFDSEKKYLAAICAAPGVFGALGLLKGRNACCYPGREAYMEGASATKNPVEVSGHIITSRGLGTAIAFSLKLIELLTEKNKAEEVGKSIVYL